MKAIQVTRGFLRKPLNSLLILSSVVALIEAVKWSVAYEPMIRKVGEAGGIQQYTSLLIRSIIIPEIFTLFIVVALINQAHQWFKIKSVPNEWQAIIRYELRFLPIFTFSFLIFNPITQTARFLLKEFPNYSLTTYWQDRILGTFTFKIYFIYLFPVILIGYTILNISLLRDFLHQRREAQEAAEAKAIEAEQTALQAAQAAQTIQPQVHQSITSEPDKLSWLGHLKGKNAIGELDFPVEDAHFFTVEDRYYYANLSKGRYLIGKTINELETELNPAQFFRIKRDYIVNRYSVLNYAYWENGKYIVRLNTPDRHEIIGPRARMQEFREWLQVSSRPTDPTSSLVLQS